MKKSIRIRGARTHNLKNIDLDLPRNQLVVITGLSGSGKSSLAFDTLYAEGQRRYVESLSSYARQFLSMMEKPDVDLIEGLSPAISIEQKATSHNPRSTVGTITEIYDYLRLLYARIGKPHCPQHHQRLEAQTIEDMLTRILAEPVGTKLLLLAPVVEQKKGTHHALFEQLRSQGFVRININGQMYTLDDVPSLDKQKKHTIEVVVDRFKVRADIRQRLAESLAATLRLTESKVRVLSMPSLEGGSQNTDTADEQKVDLLFSTQFACHTCGFSLTELTPRMFSFNNPLGACSYCDGLGESQVVDIDKIVPDVNLTLAQGAIAGWTPLNGYYYQWLVALSQHYHFSLDVPFKDIPEKFQKIILHGSDDEIAFQYDNPKARYQSSSEVKLRCFEGVLAVITRRYHETTTQSIRDNLEKYVTIKCCSYCDGHRLKPALQHVLISGHSLPAICDLSIAQTHQTLSTLALTGTDETIAEKILIEINARLQFLMDVGLNYLTLGRSAQTLSGGEAQRIRLASQIGSGLVGVMYILDEPSIGLHQRDNERLLNTLRHLRDLGNSVIVVEHDEDAIRAADFVVDIGPAAGIHGGQVIATGTAVQLESTKDSLTGQYLSGQKTIPIPLPRTLVDYERMITIVGANCNNLNNVTLQIPLGLMTCVTGVSGSGKSSLINQTLYPLAAMTLNHAGKSVVDYADIDGLQHCDKVINIDQSPIGRTPRSNPATYTGLFTVIRELFAETLEARSRGYTPGRFSFNVKGGRCSGCDGDGMIKVEMHFLADLYVTCDLCKGQRYNRETLEVLYKGKSIANVLAMTVEEGLSFFSAIPSLQRKLQTLMDVGLSYIQLGQSATTLSGGEAQRIKLAKELSKRDTGKTLYILDEPTTGLHFHDIAQLLDVLNRLKAQGNTIVIIEHNLDVIKTADWIIDVGPEGGSGGGDVVAVGAPEDIVKVKQSITGKFLKNVLD